jgi:hypothetical protein
LFTSITPTDLAIGLLLDEKRAARNIFLFKSPVLKVPRQCPLVPERG